MLTREGFVVADMSAQSPLQRSSWKAEAIRRGDLKISGPIPITEHLPLNDDEEREYAEKGALEDSVQPRDSLDRTGDRPVTPQRPAQPPPPVPELPSALRSNPVEPSQSEQGPARQPSRSPPRMPQVSDIPRESAVQTASYTPPTPYRSTPESATKAANKRKRKSGLRNVFRKMFGRKGRDEEEHEDEPVHRGHSYHHSDPGLLRQSPPREQKTPSGPRISDLPVEDLRPLHPLGQHLPFPMNVNAPQASPPHEYLTFDMQRPDIGRRRASLPIKPSASVHRHSLDDVRSRLSTWEERPDDEPEPSPGIGIALTSSSHAVTPLHSKRRSRSADALRDLVKDRGSIERRRSAEIRYWRNSYMSGSMTSRPQTAKTVETIRSVQAQEPTLQELDTDSIIEMSATLVQQDDPETPELNSPEREEVREVKAPVSAFNFGNLKSAFSDEESAPEVHEEAPPPPVRSPHRLSIEDRVQHLESKYDNLEFSVRRLSTRNNRQTIILESAPKGLRTRNRSSSSRSISASRSRSTPSIHQEPMHQSSNDTLDAGAASPTLMRPSTGISGEEKDRVLLKMYEALKHERLSRKALEQQVRTLQQDVSDLHALVNKLIASATATSPSYPTPSPDTLITATTEERMLTPRAIRSGSFEASFHKDANHIRESVISKFSRSDETGSESGFEGGYAPYGVEQHSIRGSSDDVQTPDIWATPKEEGFSGSGFFHEKRSRDDLRGYV